VSKEVKEKEVQDIENLCMFDFYMKYKVIYQAPKKDYYLQATMAST
jgi:hypothetical protein